MPWMRMAMASSARKMPLAERERFGSFLDWFDLGSPLNREGGIQTTNLKTLEVN